MSDRLDNELSKRIRSVFETYDEPYDTANWRRLVRKKRKRMWIGYVYRGGIAASLAAVLFTAGWLLFREQEPSQLAGNTHREEPPAVQEGQREAQDRGAAGEGGQFGPGETEAQPLVREDEELQLREQDGPERVAQEGRTAVPQRGTRVPAEAEPRPAASRKGGAEMALVTSLGPVVHPGIAPAASAPLSPRLQRQTVQMSREEGRGPEPHAVAKPDNDGQDRQKGKRNEDLVVLGEEEANKKESGTSGVDFGFMTTSMMNYARGNQSNQVHFGAGITSGIKLGRHFSIHSGVILAQNSLSLNENNPVVQSGRTARKQQDAYFSNVSMESAQMKTFVEEVNTEYMDIDLLLVDIPLNVTYQVNISKRPLLITGGVSSFAFIDQKYATRNYIGLQNRSAEENITAPRPQVQDESTLSHFDFARQFNFAIGTMIPLGTKTDLIIEPYIKHPLGRLTSERVRYGSAGLNLRLNFGK